MPPITWARMKLRRDRGSGSNEYVSNLLSAPGITVPFLPKASNDSRATTAGENGCTHNHVGSLGESTLNRAWSGSEHIDVLGPQFNPQGFAEGLHIGFGSGIVRGLWHTLPAHQRGKENDSPATALGEPISERYALMQNRKAVEFEHVILLAQVGLEQWTRSAVAC